MSNKMLRRFQAIGRWALGTAWGGVLLTLPLHAEVYSPRLVGPAHPDAYSLTTLTAHPLWNQRHPQARAEALFAWLTDPSRGLVFVEAGAREGADPVAEFELVGDPVKTLAVYGYGDRRALAACLAALWTAGGWGQARLALRADAPQWIAELEVDGVWRAYDVATRALVTGETHSPRYFAVPTGHTLGYVLRRGERFTQWWSPPAERWHLTASELQDGTWREWLDTPPRGPKISGQAGQTPLHTLGQFVYEPALRGSGRDLADGMTTASNVTVTAEGLTLQQPGEGFVIFAVQAPYIIVPEVGKLEDPKDDREAAIVELDGSNLTVSYSLNYGSTWQTVETKSFPVRFDLTSAVAGSYGYWLRIDLKGAPGRSVLNKLRLTTWVQMARRLFPAVQPGRNAFTLKTGDHAGDPSFPVVLQASTAEENSFLRPVIRPPHTFQAGHPQQRVVGPFTARLSAPPGAKIVWFTLGGSFAFAGASSSARLGYALEQPQAFRQIPLPALPREQTYEHYHHDVDVQLPQAAETVYVQAEGRPALNQFRLTAHCRWDQPRTVSPLKITHRWTEGGQPREFTTTLRGRGEYAFDAGNEVVNEWVEFFVPGDETSLDE